MKNNPKGDIIEKAKAEKSIISPCFYSKLNLTKNHNFVMI